LSAQTAIAFFLALASTALTNVAYLREHDAAAALPALSLRRPLHSVQALLTDRSWLVGFALESSGFALYVANFASYNKTYGAFGGVIVFLVWLWISNIAILLGAEFNAELERGRQIHAGHPAEEEPFLEPRDTRKL